MEAPTLADVLSARERVYLHMRPSPLLHHPLLDEWVGCRVLVKHENHNPTGAFKIRGGLNLVAQLSDAERQAGLIAASTGNHGQSLGLACQLHGVRCPDRRPGEQQPRQGRSDPGVRRRDHRARPRFRRRTRVR